MILDKKQVYWIQTTPLKNFHSKDELWFKDVWSRSWLWKGDRLLNSKQPFWKVCTQKMKLL
jgi:hypothetical protein